MALKLTDNYWDNKFWAYMHDPIDKCFDVKGHVERAKRIVEIFGIEPPNKDFWKKADGIASGFERGQIVGYSPDEEKSGAVDFLKEPILTHPTGEKAHIKIDLNNINPSSLFKELMDFLKKEIGMKPGTGGYSDKFGNDPESFKKARFFYTHLVLRFRLASKNIGGIGALWHRLPADTRFPDHSIWQHNALVSAIQSCYELGGEDELGMMVFSITPVQGFIENARKLRDYWVGSVFLSYLAFEGIRWVMENLGPDHILYPSLIDQFLVNEYLRKIWKVDDGVNFLNKESEIASFPNKFLFLIPFSKSEQLAGYVKQNIIKAWEEIYTEVMDGIIKKLDLSAEQKQHVENVFKRQNSNFWEIKWASVKMLKQNNKDEIKRLLPEKNYKGNFTLLKFFNEMIKDKTYYEKSGIGALYSVSHSLCQAALAAEKTKKYVLRNVEPGEKCHLCGEFEVLHADKYQGDIGASEYKQKIKSFWEKLKEVYGGEDSSELKENERLCSICLTKRLGPYFLKQNKAHILNRTFNRNESFPSTTYMALTNYFKEKEIYDEEEKRKKAQEIHEKDDNISNQDRYFAILLMDGDNMGKLVAGESIAASWESIMHPSIVEKLNTEKIEEVYSKNWQKIFEQVPKRNLTPSIHASISESLGDFSIYGVAHIIRKYEGKLIYAGGDDVCAVLPMDTALLAAQEIRNYYNSTFKIIYQDRQRISIKDIGDKFSPRPGKLSINLGRGENISISAGILICHHKASLKHMIKEANKLLKEKAKEQGGRNAIAIQLKKRSGGDRFFICKWDDEKLECLKRISQKIGTNLSRSFAYKLAKLEYGIISILDLDGYLREEKFNLLNKFIEKQLNKSELKGMEEKEQKELAKDITQIIIYENMENGQAKSVFTNEPLIIAGFLNRKNNVKKEQKNV